MTLERQDRKEKGRRWAEEKEGKEGRRKVLHTLYGMNEGTVGFSAPV